MAFSVEEIRAAQQKRTSKDKVLHGRSTVVRHCPHCKAMANDQAVFCYSCGQPLTEELPVQVEEKAPPTIQEEGHKKDISSPTRVISPLKRVGRLLKTFFGVFLCLLALVMLSHQGFSAGMLFLGLGIWCFYSANKQKEVHSKQKKPLSVPENTSKQSSPPVDTLTASWTIGGETRNQNVIDYIQNNVGPDEEIVAMLLGAGEKTSIGAAFSEKAGAALGGSYLLVTEKKVVAIKSGVGTWSTGAFGIKAKTFFYDHITSVDVSKGLMFGEIEIVTAGMVEKGSGGFFSAASKDSVVQFEKEYFDEVQKLTSRIREMAQASRQLNASGPVNIPEQIKTLAELRDKGALTDEEFEDKKKKLLSKI